MGSSEQRREGREGLYQMSRDGELTLRALLAPIAGYLSREDATELVINRPGEVGIETRAGWEWFAVPEMTYRALSRSARQCRNRTWVRQNRCVARFCRTDSACRFAGR